MTRKYDMTRRAKRQEETRRRIVEAAVELHQTVGMARTTISAIAEKAGVERLRMALSEVYAYHRRTEPMMANFIRDAPVHPLTREMAEPYFQLFERIRYVLATGWGVEDERLALLLATLGHALDFQTWRSLVRQQSLNDEQAIEVMVGMVRCLMLG